MQAWPALLAGAIRSIIERGQVMTACTYQGLADIKFEPIAGLDGVDHEENLERVNRITRAALDLLGNVRRRHS